MVTFVNAYTHDTIINSNIELQNNALIPNFLLGTYTGSLMASNVMTADGACTIKHNNNAKYTLLFSNGVSSINNIRFTRDDDTYISSFIYKGKTFALTLDEDGDLAVAATSGYSSLLSFSGEKTINKNNKVRIDNNGTQRVRTGNRGTIVKNGNQRIKTTNDGDVHIQNGTQRINTNSKIHGNKVSVKNGNQTINSGGRSTSIKNGKQTIHTNQDGDIHIQNGNQRVRTKGKRRNSGNVSISTNGNGVNINGNVNIGNDENHQQHDGVIVTTCPGWTTCNINNCTHSNAPSHYYDCGSHDIAELPQEAIGFYKGKLNGYNLNTNKGICNIVETGCKTYRLEFSNNIPTIHGVQFGRPDRFKDYTSVVIEGQYSAAIEVDMRFNDLTIDGKIMTIHFDGDKQ